MVASVGACFFRTQLDFTWPRQTLHRRSTQLEEDVKPRLLVLGQLSMEYSVPVLHPCKGEIHKFVIDRRISKIYWGVSIFAHIVLYFSSSLQELCVVDWE